MNTYAEFMEGLYRARIAMEKAGLTPCAIDLSSPDDGVRLLAMIPPGEVVGQWLREDGSAGHSIEIAGLLVRWPTRQIALRGGGYKDFP